MRLLRLAFALALVASAAPASGAGRLITATDIYSFHWAADPRISPDGAQVVYTLVSVKTRHDGYETALWIVPASGGAPRQLTSGPHDSSPRWSPDGSQLAFLRASGEDGKTNPSQIYLLSMRGGEARPLTDLPKGASSPVWSPNGHFIAFSSTHIPTDFDKKKAPDAEPPSDVRIITRAVYRMNGTGYLDPDRPSHIWVVAVPEFPGAPATARPVTSGRFTESGFLWSRDSRTLYFTSERVLEPYYEPPHSELYSVPFSGGAVVKIAAIDGPIGAVSLNPAGDRAAFVGEINHGDGVAERSYSQPDLFVTSLEPGSTPKNLTEAYDFDIGSGVGGDQAPPRASSRSVPFWSADGRFVFVNAAEHGSANLQRIDAASGKVEPLTKGDHDVASYDAASGARRAVALISTPTNIGDLYLVNEATGALTRLTKINDPLFSQLDLSEPEMIWYKSFDGRRIQAWVQRPPGFQPGRKYPMILNIHGGPHAAYGYTFDHEFHWMAAKGYVVLYPNPRGSTTYGQEFGNVIQYKYPGDDFKDLMAGVDDLIARGWVDPQKLGVTGGSGGGVLTNWSIGHTGRFRAAVSQRSIADWTDFWYDADFSLFTPSWFRGAPWEQQADFKARSPITYIDKINTPLMLIEGESDFRCPPASGGEQMFRALKYKRIPTVMIRFPGETHELSRSGKPVHRVERLQHIVAWFDKYVQGEEIHTYDVQ